MDDIWFRAPVEIGAMLYFNSQICYVQVILISLHEISQSSKTLTIPLQDNYMQTRVSAEVVDPQTGEMSITNVFHFTFLAKEKTPPFIVPKTYHEVGKNMKNWINNILAGHDVPDWQTTLQSLHKSLKISTEFQTTFIAPSHVCLHCFV